MTMVRISDVHICGLNAIVTQKHSIIFEMYKHIPPEKDFLQNLCQI